MADLNDLKKLGEELMPIIKGLFALIKGNQDKDDRRLEAAAVKRLLKLIKAADKNTPASLEQRAAAIVSVRGALTETLIQAASNPSTLTATQVRIIETQRNSLRNKFGLLAEMDAFNAISSLLTRKQIENISKQLKKAEEEIAQRTKAKHLLDTIVKVIIEAGKLAAKLA